METEIVCRIHRFTIYGLSAPITYVLVPTPTGVKGCDDKLCFKPLLAGPDPCRLHYCTNFGTRFILHDFLL